MRRSFAHNAVVFMEAHGDERAPGAAITTALCGDPEHVPPCPLAPHHVATERSGDQLRLRVLFATDPAAETEVRDRIRAALSEGTMTGPDGVATHWRFGKAEPSPVRDDETEHAERLSRS